MLGIARRRNKKKRQAVFFRMLFFFFLEKKSRIFSRKINVWFVYNVINNMNEEEAARLIGLMEMCGV